MERLTKRDEFGNADIIALKEPMHDMALDLAFPEFNKLTEALNRFAAYEDLDLMPRELRDKLRKLEWYEAKFGHRLAQRWDQIAAAEDEGRLVVLTCKVGANVYQEYAGQVYESTITRIIIRQNAPILYDTDRGLAFNDHAIGRSIFLNRWEAERALEGNDNA